MKEKMKTLEGKIVELASQTYTIHKVYVIFEREGDKAKCMEECSTSWMAEVRSIRLTD